mmetsp:Transcript_23192/g.32391  ORF Transcript_23192/g.32391 Transcript_23192/m.32391 type:complete len:220 (+) Transcript_23192:176-835(+)
MFSSWFVKPFATILLASSSSPQNRYERLISTFEMAHEVPQEADDILSDKNDNNDKTKFYQDAVQLYEEAIMLGRKPAVALYELEQEQQDDNKDESDSSGSSSSSSKSSSSCTLEWLIDLYCKSASAKMEINDMDGARGEAWAATVFSKNAYFPAIQCMEKVCEASGDMIGQISALKQMLDLIKTTSTEGESFDNKVNADEKDAMLTKLQILETKLMKKS